MMTRCQYRWSAWLPLIVILCGTGRGDDAPVTVPPHDPSIHYVGRIDNRDSVGPRFNWSGSEVAIHFQGTGVQVQLDDKPHLDCFQVVVDGSPTTVIKTERDQTLYRLASQLPDGEHTVRLVKRTEAKIGTVQFFGFQLDPGGKALPWTAVAPHRIEIIGDSISCGFGDETNSKMDPFTPGTENNYLTYGALTARRFGAEYTCLAWTGYKMYPDKTISSIWDLNLPPDPASKADLTQAPPEAIVINLGTNDFWDQVPDDKAWVGAYESFLKTLRTAHPGAHIFLTNSVMLIPQRNDKLTAMLREIEEASSAAGDAKVHVVEFPTEDRENGMGSADHPNLKTHAIMADILSEAFAKEMGWTPTEEPTASSKP